MTKRGQRNSIDLRQDDERRFASIAGEVGVEHSGNWNVRSIWASTAMSFAHAAGFVSFNRITHAVSPASATLHIGDTLLVSVSTRICPGQAEPTLAPYAWSSSDSSVAKVSASSGLVLALHDGTVTITATSVDEPLVKGAMALRIAP